MSLAQITPQEIAFSMDNKAILGSIHEAKNFPPLEMLPVSMTPVHTVIILDGNSGIDAHTWWGIGNWICLRHLLTVVNTKFMFSFSTCARRSQLPSNAR